MKPRAPFAMYTAGKKGQTRRNALPSAQRCVHWLRKVSPSQVSSLPTWPAFKSKNRCLACVQKGNCDACQVVKRYWDSFGRGCCSSGTLRHFRLCSRPKFSISTGRFAPSYNPHFGLVLVASSCARWFPHHLYDIMMRTFDLLIVDILVVMQLDAK